MRARFGEGGDVARMWLGARSAPPPGTAPGEEPTRGGPRPVPDPAPEPAAGEAPEPADAPAEREPFWRQIFSRRS
ncbi:hypothetical protein BJF78_02900 [Pseudonocardia sp. CNS-139]|nr:hypothetical protein BJF78_02900 [Pseudonocardia sp. CNS-139]